MRTLGKLLTANLLTLSTAVTAQVAIPEPAAPAAAPVAEPVIAEPTARGGLDLASAIEIAAHPVRRDGTALVVNDPAYEARFERTGFSLDSLTIATRGIDTPWTPARNRAQRPIAPGMREQVTARDGHVEWDVVLTRPHAGDVRIVAEVAGRMRAAGNVIRVRAADGSRYTIGELIVLDADGRQLHRTLPAIDGEHLALEVPARALRDARYPVTLDPVVGPESATPMGAAASGARKSTPEADFDGANHLVVWSDTRNGSRDIYGARISETGELIDPSGFPIATGSHNEDDPHVAYGDGHFLVIWEDDRSGVNDLYAARVDRDGTVRSGQLTVCTATGAQNRPRVSWNAASAAFLAIWEDNRISNTNVYATRINAGGVVTPNGFAITDSTEPDLLAEAASRGAGAWIVVWERGNDLRRTTVSATGTVGALNGTAYGISPGFAAIDDLSLDAGANDLYLVFRAFASVQGSAWGFTGRRLAASGDLSGAADELGFTFGPSPASVSAARDGSYYFASGDGIYYVGMFGAGATDAFPAEVSAGASRGLSVGSTGWVQPLTSSGNRSGSAYAIAAEAGYQDQAAVAYDGTRYFVAWRDPEDGGIAGVRVSADGALLDSTERVITASAYDSPAVTGDANGFLVAYREFNEVVVRRVAGNGAVAPQEVVLDDLGSDVAAASTVARHLVVWSNGGDVRGAILDTNGVVLTGDPITISSAAGNQDALSVASDGNGFLVTWADARNGNSDIYGTRVSATGVVNDPSGIPISTQSSSQSEPSVAFADGSYHVAWTDARNGNSDVYGARVTTAGAVSDPSGIAIATGSTEQNQPAVVNDGVRALISFRAGSELRGQRVLAGTIRDLSSGFLIGAGGEQPAASSAGPIGRRLVAYSRRSAEAPYHGSSRVFTRVLAENDQFAGAFAITGSSATGSNVAYQKEAGEPNHVSAGGASAWWTWTAPGYGSVTLNTNGSSFDTLLAAYTGGAVNALTQLAADDDGGDGNASLITFPTTAATTYRIAVDGFNGATGSVALNLAFTPDTTAPDTTLAAGPTATNQSQLTFSFSATEAGSSFACSLNGAAFTTCTSPITYQGLADGQHVFQVRATDPAGNTDATPASRTVTIDRAAPDTVLDSGPSGAVSSTGASFTFSATEAGSSFTCALDAGSFASCTSPHALSGLSQGSHTFQVRATDAAGNLDQTAATRTWTVDTTPPDVTITAGPSGTVGSNDVTFSFTGSEPLASTTCTMDGAASSCSSPVTYAGLSNASHTFTVTGSDAAGNTDPTAASRTFTVDSNLPDTVIDAGPAGTIASSSTSISFSSTKAGSTFTCSIDAGPGTACTSPRAIGPLADGTHTVTVTAIDASGNTDPSPASRTFTIDTRAPDTSITSGPATLHAATSATVTFASDEAAATFECRLDAGAFTACLSPMTFSGLTEASHTISVRARDMAGNLDAAPASRTFTVDVTAPQTSLAGSSVAGGTATFTFSSNDGSATFTCSLDGDAFAACVSPKAYAGLADGSHTFEVRASDPAGNLDATPAAGTVLVDTIAPDTTILTGPGTVVNDATPELTFAGSEPGSTFRCAIDAGVEATCASPFSPATLGDGEHTVRVRATDASGNPDPTPASRTFTVDTLAPIAAISGPSGAYAAQSLTYALDANETGIRFECRLDAESFAACPTPWTRAGVSEGAHMVQVRAVDAAGNTGPAASLEVTVDVTAPETSVAGPNGPTSGNNVNWTFGSEPGTTFQCSLDGAPATSCTSPRSYAGLSDGSHSFEVVAIDPAGNVDPSPASRVVSVDTAAPDTLIETGPTGTVNSTSASFTVSASEPGATIACRLDGVSVGCAATHSGLAAGAHTFTATATDTAGNVDPTPASRTWTIDLSGPDTFIASGPSGSVAATSATFTFGSDEASSFQCALDAGAFVACGSGITYETLAQGVHQFRVRAIDAGGNLDGSPASRSWTVDTNVPDTTILSGPSGTVASTSATVTFSSNDATSTFRCALDAGSFEACTSPVTYAGLGQGAHQVTVRATDAAGNTDLTPATRSFTVDTQGPVITVTGSSLSGNDLSVSFTSEASATFACALDAGTFSACASPAAFNDLADGAHLIRIRGTDAVGNVGAASEVTVNVDTTAPDTGIDGTVSGNAISVTFSSDDATAVFRCAIDSLTLVTCANPRTFTGLSQGSHTVRVAAVDPAGNVDPSVAILSFTVDTVAPETTITSAPPALISSTSATVSFVASEPGSSFRCSLDGAAATVCGSPRTFAALSQGVHAISVTAIDPNGNADPSPAQTTFTVDSVAPETTITQAPAELTNQAGFTVRFASSEAASLFRCALDDGATSACTSPHTVNGLTDGTHQLRIEAIDQAGNVDPSAATVTVTVDTVAADTVITSGPPAVTSARAASFAFAAEDAEATFRCSLDGAAFTACATPIGFDELAAGEHTFRVRALDRAGNLDPTPAERRWLIDPSIVEVAFTRPTPGFWLQDQQIASGGAVVVAGPVTIEVRAADPGSGVASFMLEIDGAPVPASEITHDPAQDRYRYLYRPATPGTHTITARATNGAGGANQATLQLATVPA